MNKIKQSFDEALKDLEVTDELKQRTLNQIKQQQLNKKVIRFTPKYYLKAMTLVSSFIIVLTIGINFLHVLYTNNASLSDRSSSESYNTPLNKGDDSLTPHNYGNDGIDDGVDSTADEENEENEEDEENN